MTSAFRMLLIPAAICYLLARTILCAPSLTIFELDTDIVDGGNTWGYHANRIVRSSLVSLLCLGHIFVTVSVNNTDDDNMAQVSSFFHMVNDQMNDGPAANAQNQLATTDNNNNEVIPIPRGQSYVDITEYLNMPQPYQ